MLDGVVASVKTIFQLHYQDQRLSAACLQCVSAILDVILKDKQKCLDARLVI